MIWSHLVGNNQQSHDGSYVANTIEDKQRQGAGAVYINVHHPDILEFLETKKENASDDARLITLSIGVVLTDLFLEKVKEDESYYVFYPKTVYDEYGVHFEDVCANMDKWYDILLNNPNVKKKAYSPRRILETISIVQGESGYPYIMFIDNVNNVNPLRDKVHFSNLCSEILQPSKASSFADYDKKEEDVIGMDISCNLSSLHISNVMETKNIKEAVYAAMDVMTSVSHKSNISVVPGIAKANRLMRSVGLGTMDLHGFFAKNYILYGSKESIEFADTFYSLMNYYTLWYSTEKAKETGETFYGFAESKYADGSYFNLHHSTPIPASQKVNNLFNGILLPTEEDWAKLKDHVMKYGLYHSNRQAVAPK